MSAGAGLFEEINSYPGVQGSQTSGGDDSGREHHSAPSSAKNPKERDPEMHQTKKGNEWHFGMKVHIGVDSQTGVVHSMTTNLRTCMT